jgi:hypothetical protein
LGGASGMTERESVRTAPFSTVIPNIGSSALVMDHKTFASILTREQALDPWSF